MLRCHLSAVSLSCPLSVSSPPTTCSTKIRPQHLFRSSSRSSVYCLTGSQKDSKDALSRIIRREAAVEGIGRKAKSKKQRKSLWPKAVLEALDEAIKDNAWYSALEVCHLWPGSFHSLLPSTVLPYFLNNDYIRRVTTYFMTRLFHRYLHFYVSNSGTSLDAKRTQN